MTTKNKMNTWHLRLALSNEVDHWNNLLSNNPDGGNFLQTQTFAILKQREGWVPKYLVYEKGTTRIVALALVRSLFHSDDLWYFPKGPGVSSDEFGAIIKATRNFITATYPNVFLVQMEPELNEKVSNVDACMVNGIQAHSSTAIVSLEPSMDAIFNSFDKRVRYGVRLGKREAIELKSVSACEENFQCMYTLMKTVAGGKGVAGIRPYSYYRYFWQAYMSCGMGRLYFAYERGVPVIGAFVIMLGRKSFYKDGGSTPLRKSKGASYLLQWQIIQDMKNVGVTTYDMLGTTPSHRRYDRTHRLYGVGLFKTGFSHEIIDYPGVYDVVFSDWKYRIWKKCVYPFLCRALRMRNRYFY